VRLYNCSVNNHTVLHTVYIFFTLLHTFRFYMFKICLKDTTNNPSELKIFIRSLHSRFLIRLSNIISIFPPFFRISLLVILLSAQSHLYLLKLHVISVQNSGHRRRPVYLLRFNFLNVKIPFFIFKIFL
jgi:hypothetical protein